MNKGTHQFLIKFLPAAFKNTLRRFWDKGQSWFLSQCKVGLTPTQLSKHNKTHRVEHRSYIVITREKAFDEVQQPLPDQSPEEPRKTSTDALMYGPPVTATEPAACQMGKEVFLHTSGLRPLCPLIALTKVSSPKS